MKLSNGLFEKLPDRSLFFASVQNKCGSGPAREYGASVSVKVTDTQYSRASPLPHKIYAASERAQTQGFERFSGLTCDAGDAARHRCELAPVAAVARSSRVRRRGRAASFAVSLSWCPLGVMPSGWNSVAASYR